VRAPPRASAAIAARSPPRVSAAARAWNIGDLHRDSYKNIVLRSTEPDPGLYERNMFFFEAAKQNLPPGGSNYYYNMVSKVYTGVDSTGVLVPFKISLAINEPNPTIERIFLNVEVKNFDAETGREVGNIRNKFPSYIDEPEIVEFFRRMELVKIG